MIAAGVESETMFRSPPVVIALVIVIDRALELR
jgi:hypothetical protein